MDGLGKVPASGYQGVRPFRHVRRAAMAKGQKRSNKEVRKPKAKKDKVIAANRSTKGSTGLIKG